MSEHMVAVVERLLAAPPEVVYDEWLDVDAFSEWMCPRPARPIAITLEPRVGGRLRIDIEELGRRFYVIGRYLTLDRPHRLRFTWSCSTWPNPELESVVSVSLEPRGEQETLMRIEHTMLPEDLVPEHLEGWERIATQLEEKLQPRTATKT